MELASVTFVRCACREICSTGVKVTVHCQIPGTELGVHVDKAPWYQRPVDARMVQDRSSTTTAPTTNIATTTTSTTTTSTTTTSTTTEISNSSSIAN